MCSLKRRKRASRTELIRTFLVGAIFFKSRPLSISMSLDMPSCSSSIVKPIHPPPVPPKLEPSISFELAHQRSPVPTRNIFASGHWKIFFGSSTLCRRHYLAVSSSSHSSTLFSQDSRQAQWKPEPSLSRKAQLSRSLGVGSACKVSLTPRQKTRDSVTCVFSLVPGGQFLIFAYIENANWRAKGSLMWTVYTVRFLKHQFLRALHPEQWSCAEPRHSSTTPDCW